MPASHNTRACEELKKGACIVYPTDTLYGMLVRASDKKAITRLYALRKRDTHKPCIILIASLGDIELFCKISPQQKKMLAAIWPARISVVVPCPDASWRYLHRGTQSLAFRMPSSLRLRALIKQTGPLVAPTVNRQGEKPAQTIKEAKAYFGDQIPLYVSGGRKKGKPSTLIELRGEGIKVLREGSDLKKVLQKCKILE